MFETEVPQNSEISVVFLVHQHLPFGIQVSSSGSGKEARKKCSNEIGVKVCVAMKVFVSFTLSCSPVVCFPSQDVLRETLPLKPCSSPLL